MIFVREALSRRAPPLPDRRLPFGVSDLGADRFCARGERPRHSGGLVGSGSQGFALLRRQRQALS
jgi:hypothetical protein